MNLTVFCDERKMALNEDGEGWWYICMLLIPFASVEDVISHLLDIREHHNFHGEMSFSDVKGLSRNSPRTAVAKDWLQYLLRHSGIDVYWEVLGIATHNLDFSCFGPGDEPTGKYATVYNRFFRTALLFSINTYFKSYDQVIISHVFHDDEGNLQNHPYFHWHLPSVVADTRIQFLNEHIEFVSSDHKKEKIHKAESQVIQLADLLVGSVSQRLDQSSGQKGKVELGDRMTDTLCTATTNSGRRTRMVMMYPSFRISD
jgi:hypothetical protein